MRYPIISFLVKQKTDSSASLPFESIWLKHPVNPLHPVNSRISESKAETAVLNSKPSPTLRVILRK